MPPSNNSSIDNFLHPYAFALKEGSEIQSDYLNYSLMLLIVGKGETLPSPTTQKSSSPLLRLLRRVK